MEALQEAKKQLSPDGWQEVCRTLISDLEDLVARHEAELPEGSQAGKTFRAEPYQPDSARLAGFFVDGNKNDDPEAVALCRDLTPEGPS